MSRLKLSIRFVVERFCPCCVTIYILCVQYQGRDKDCIIVSLVQLLHQPSEDSGNLLNDWRRVNVAFTRAKAKLIIVGSSSSLRHNHLFSSLLETLHMHEWVYRLPKYATNVSSDREALVE